MHVPWRSNFFSEFSQLDIKESCSRNRFNTIPFNSRNNELEGARETRRSNDRGGGEGEGVDHAWPINRAINDSFFFFRDEEEENRLMDFMGALGMKLQVA